MTVLLPLLFLEMAACVSAAGKTFKVFHNTLDPAVFGTAGGAHLINATGSGHVEALTICVRFQVQRSPLVRSTDVRSFQM